MLLTNPIALPEQQIQSINPGDIVKLAADGERFWCVVTAINENTFQGVVDSYTMSLSYPYGSPVEFDASKIHEIFNGD